MQTHDDVIKRRHCFGLLAFVGESTGHRWIPLTQISDAELWYFHWSAPEQTVEQSIVMPVIWDAIALIMTSLWYEFLCTTMHPKKYEHSWRCVVFVLVWYRSIFNHFLQGLFFCIWAMWTRKYVCKSIIYITFRWVYNTQQGTSKPYVYSYIHTYGMYWKYIELYLLQHRNTVLLHGWVGEQFNGKLIHNNFDQRHQLTWSFTSSDTAVS